jgi:hypothetical protein
VTDLNRSGPEAHSRLGSSWQIALVILAVAYAVPLAYVAYNRLEVVARQARERLIVEYRLWELHPEYKGTPQAWTRFASRLLTDGQLLRRVHAKYGALATEIELDYRRDLSVAQGEVVLVVVAAWGIPVGALYGLGILLTRRRRRVLEKPPEKPGYSDARYRP